MTRSTISSNARSPRLGPYAPVAMTPAFEQGSVGVSGVNAHASAAALEAIGKQKAHRTLPSRSKSSRIVHTMLDQLDQGCLEVVEPDGTLCVHGRPMAHARATGRPVRITVHDDAMHARVLSSGDIGFAEAYIQRQWSTDDLVGVLALLMRHRDALERAIYGSWWGSLLHRIRHHVLRRNSRAGSRRNIVAHYDLGNDFYREWLDASMNYSSAWFGGNQALTLEQAQGRKVDRALDEARIDAGVRVLEIGCGWGAVAERAAQRGANVVGVTLSDEQLLWAQQRLRAQGAGGQADLQLLDYRDIGKQAGFEPFDAVVSIEMFEAVGQAYWPSYFETLARCLKRGGRACVQTITIRDDLFERYAKSTDFIQQYVFPGGMLPSRSAFESSAQRAGLVIERELAFGEDYATTLMHWRSAFLAKLDAFKSQGFDDDFLRLWDFYLAYCQAAFSTGNTQVRQFTLRHAK